MRFLATPTWLRTVLLGFFALFVLIVVIALVLSPAGVSYNVTAQTERIELSIDSQPNWRWNLEDVEFIEGWETIQSWNGQIRLASPVNIVMQRVAYGRLWVHVQCRSDSIDEPCESAGVVFENKGLSRRPLGPEFEILVDGIPARAEMGKTVSLSISGHVSLGRSVGMDTAVDVGILREGRVTMLGRNIVGEGVYDGGRVTLEVGDRFEVTEINNKSETLGFVVVNERPGLTAAYRVNGSNATVYRPGGGSYAVATTAFSRLTHDPLFRILAWLFAIAAASAQVLASIAQLIDGASAGQIDPKK